MQEPKLSLCLHNLEKVFIYTLLNITMLYLHKSMYVLLLTKQLFMGI